MSESVSLAQLGRLVAKKRDKVGIRATARAIGLSPATLSRVENGQLPDLANFTKLCQWLELDPASVLGFDPASRDRSRRRRPLPRWGERWKWKPRLPSKT